MKQSIDWVRASRAAAVVSLAAALALSAWGCARSPQEETLDLSSNALAAAEAAGVSAPAGGELHVYSWSDYIAPEVKEGFEKALGCRIVIDTFDSNEAMYAKLKAGGTGYDVLTPTSYQIALMAREGLIAPLDLAKVPNLSGFDSRFAAQLIDPSFTYNIPYATTYTGFVYLKDKLPEGADPSTWAILGNPALRGRITLLDDIRETIGAALMYLGYSINSDKPEELDAAVAQVREWRSNIRKFGAESYKTEVPAGASYLAHGYSSDAIQVILGDEEEGVEPRPDVVFVLPREGFTFAFDEMVLAANAPRPDLAYAFMNYIYDPEVALANMEYICAVVPVKEAVENLDEDLASLILLDEETLSHAQVLRGFDDRPDVLELYNRAWDRIKATDNP